MVLVGLLLVAASFSGAGSAAAAAKSKPVRCAAGAFQVAGDPLVAGAAAPQAGTIVLDGTASLPIDIGCGQPVRARVAPRRGFDKVTATWKRCGALARVRLQAKLAKPACGVLTGVLKAKKASPRRFVAQRAVATTTTTTLAPSTTTTTVPCVATPETCDGVDDDCDGVVDDGDLCTLANAQAVCTAGACQVGACLPGFADCNEQALDGCEIDTQSDAENCGACETVCPGALICASGACAASCNGVPAENCVTLESEGVDEQTNGSVETAVPVVIGGAIEGTIGNVLDDLADIDAYAFQAVAGDLLRVTITARVGSTFQAAGAIAIEIPGFLLTQRRIRPGADASTATREFVIARTGTHFLVVQDHRNPGDVAAVGGASLTYRARLSRVTRTPTPAALPLVQEPADVAATSDVALFSFDALIGQEITAFTTAARLSTPSAVDTILLLFDGSTVPPTLVAENDDEGATRDSLVSITARESRPYLLVLDYYDVPSPLPADRRVQVDLASPCYHCAEALGFQAPADAGWCSGTRAGLLSLGECTCGDGGACQAQCATDCSGDMVTEACDACFRSPAGCGPALDACLADAGPNVCGDGFLRTGEGCDDGNLADGDGCSPGCTIEDGFSCVTELAHPSVCASCSDGSMNGSETDVDCGGGCPACGLDDACARNEDCGSESCVDGTCVCPVLFHRFSVTSSTASVFETAQWPGGQQTFELMPGCSVTIANPSGGIGVLSGSTPFAALQAHGYSTCAGVGGENGDGCDAVSCPPLGIATCVEARPTCTTVTNGSASATYDVQCSP